MSFLPLIIDDVVRADLKRIAANAVAAPVPLSVLQALAVGQLQPEHVNKGKTCRIPMGFEIVFTHEEQPGGVLRHLSVSIDLPRRVPHPEAVRMLMEEIGFILPLEQCMVWQERCGPERVAVNVIEPLDGNWDPHRVH